MKTREEKVNILRKHIDDILSYSEYMKVKNFNHHYGTNIFEHCVDVSYYSYKICKVLNLDYISAARGGILHDFFLYDWKKYKPKEGLHGLVHPTIAYNNAKAKFYLNKKEKDIILKHMFPVTIKPPKYLESIIVCLVDKICATSEMINYSLKIFSIFLNKYILNLDVPDFIYSFSFLFLINIEKIKGIITI